MKEVNMMEIEIDKPVIAIISFGPSTVTTGMKLGEYYQVTIDPSMCSPSGEYIRFGFHENDEITGWQRVAAMTIAEVLGDSDKKLSGGVTPTDDGSTVKMMALV